MLAALRFLGVSNVSLRHLEQMIASRAEPPAFVQNRCFARLGWDREVRLFCAERKIIYQGFSLLTANPEVLHHPRDSTAGSPGRRYSSADYLQLCPRRWHPAANRYVQPRTYEAGLRQP